MVPNHIYNGGKTSGADCSIALPQITKEMVADYYPQLISYTPDGYSWSQIAVDFACLLKTHCVKRRQSDDK